MTRAAGPEHWWCDHCGEDGGVVDKDETIPHRWLSFDVRVGCPQTAEEQSAKRTLHTCPKCSNEFLSHLRFDSNTRARLRAIWNRDLNTYPLSVRGSP